MEHSSLTKRPPNYSSTSLKWTSLKKKNFLTLRFPKFENIHVQLPISVCSIFFPCFINFSTAHAGKNMTASRVLWESFKYWISPDAKRIFPCLPSGSGKIRVSLTIFHSFPLAIKRKLEWPSGAAKIFFLSLKDYLFTLFREGGIDTGSACPRIRWYVSTHHRIRAVTCIYGYILSTTSKDSSKRISA